MMTLINHLGSILPKSVQRAIVDFPGTLWLLERLGARQTRELTTPEGDRLVINLLWHGFLADRIALSSHEPHLRRAITDLTRPGMVAYDIGANVGIFTLLFAHLVGERGRVVAFEPEPNNITCLAQTLEINSLENVKLLTCAVGNSIGHASFDRRGGAFSGRLIGSEPGYKPTTNTDDVEVTTIDHLVNQGGYPPPDIVKIDVEGNEGMVLEGMKNVLSSHSPIIVCELHPHLGDPTERVRESLEQHGYSISDVKDRDTSLPVSTPGSLDGHRHIAAIKS